MDTYFIHHGGQIVLQFDGDAAGDLSHRYLWGPAVDEILADEQVSSLSTDGDVLWPLTDHQHSVRDLVSYDGVLDETNIENHITYDAYGNKTESDAVDHLFKYTGRLFDEATGLQNNLNRWYDASVGRWVSEDPIGFEGGDANLYRYCNNWAMNATDPLGFGLWSWVWTGNWNASDEEWDAASEGAGQYYLENAGKTHAALNAVGGGAGGLGVAVSSTIALIEGDLLHDAVENNANPNPPGGAANNLPGGVGNNLPVAAPPPQQKPQNFGQKTTEIIIIYGPTIIIIAGVIEQSQEGGGEEIEHGETPAGESRPDLFRTGNTKHPDPIRIVHKRPDIVPDPMGNVRPTNPPSGLSTYDSVDALPTSGRVWKLPGDADLPSGLTVTPNAPPPGHNNIGPTHEMSLEEFLEALGELPWVDTCTKIKKKK